MKTLINIFFFFVGCLFLYNPVYSFESEMITQTVRGRVTDKQTMQPLPGANVIILGSDPIRGTAADVDGHFTLRHTPIGRIDLLVSYVGYQEVLVANINHISGKETVLDIQMNEIVMTGKEVVVMAQASKGEAINAMSSVSVRGFTVEETERFAGSRNDVSRMASSYAGVVGNNDARNDIVVRGNSPSGLLWRLEGIDIPSPNHWAAFGSSGGPVSMLNNTLLTNSDFMTGAFPAEYGNAIASVFDLRMRNGNNQQHEHLFQVGFNGFELGTEGPVFQNNNGSYLVNFRYSTMEVFEKVGMDFGSVGVPKYHDLSFKVNLPSTRMGSFSLFGLGGRSNIEIWDSRRDPDEEVINYYAGEGYDLTNGSDVGVIGMNHLVNVGKSGYFRSTLAVTHHQTTTRLDSLLQPHNYLFNIYGNDFAETRLAGAFSLNSRITNRLSMKTGLSVSQHKLSLADSTFSYRYNQIIPIREQTGDAWLLQPFFQSQYRLNNALTLNAGLHYQVFLLNNTHAFEPRIGLSYALKGNHRLSFGYGRHSQILPVNIYFIQAFTGDNEKILPNKDTGMIKSDHLVLGYDVNINHHTRIKLETYYQSLFNVPVNGHQADSYSMLNQGANFGVWSPDTLINDGLGQNIGVELTLERFFHKGFYYLLTASVFDSKYRASDKKWRNTAFNNNYVGNLLAGKEWLLPSKTASRQSLIDINIKATVAGGQRYIPNQVSFDEHTGLYVTRMNHVEAFSAQYPAYFRVDFSIGFKMNTGRLTQEWMVEITNLLNHKNVFNAGFNKETGEEFYNYQLPLMIIPQWRIRF